MAYGTVKVDSITFTNGGIDQTVTVSGIVQSISGNITATGTIQAATIIGTSTVSGATVTGDSGQYGNLNSISGVFTTQLSGATITGDIGQYATLTGISGVFTTAISGATITGNTIQASTVTGISGVYTTQLSGATITGNTGSFTTVTGGVATITSGVFALGTDSLPSISFSSDPNTGIYSPGADQLAISTNGTGRLSIDANGNVSVDTNTLYVDAVNDRVAVGTTSPTRTLDVVGTGIYTAYTGNTGATFNIVPGANGQDGVSFIHSYTSGTGYGPLKFEINGEKMRLDASGRLLVGTDSARANFYNSTNTANILVEGTTSTNSTIAIVSNRATADPNNEPTCVLGRSGSDSLSSNTLLAADNAVGRISFQGNDGSEFVELAHIRAFVDGTPGADDMPGRLVFSTTADEASSPTERMRITSTGQVRLAGAGITFNGDTATANELDDYEEGTWTPVIVGTTTAGTATYSAQVGRYTKIGNLVNFTVYLSWSSGTGTGDLKINGLPFTVSSEANRLFACSVAWVENLALTAAHVPQAALYSNETRINIQSYPTGGTSFSNVAYDAAAAIAITGSYTV